MGGPGVANSPPSSPEATPATHSDTGPDTCALTCFCSNSNSAQATMARPSSMRSPLSALPLSHCSSSTPPITPMTLLISMGLSRDHCGTWRWARR